MSIISRNLFERLTQDRQKSADVLEKQSMQGIKTSVSDKYSESAHFIDELLQNADDAKATKARFVLSSSGLIFAHNGSVHFSISNPYTEAIDYKNKCLGDINAITSIGQSNKDNAQIGQFGIGFKAVFQYTQTPKIYAPPFFFKIERFIVPIPLPADHPERQADETLFYLPFDKPSHAFPVILKKLTNLTHPLLFLNYLTEINWLINNNKNNSQGKYTKSIHQNESDYSIIQENNNDTTENFLLINKNQVTIAYKRSKNGKILHNQTYPAYCFFPTKELTQLRFIIQAPFLLTDNRESIKPNESINTTLIKQLAELTANSLNLIKKLGMLTDKFFKVLPIDLTSENLFKPISEAILNRLQTQPLLPTTETGQYTTRHKAYLAENPALMRLLPSKQLSQFLNNENSHWVFPQITPNHQQLRTYIKQHLINQEITTDKLIQTISKAFLQQQTDKWLIQLYSYFFNKAKNQHEKLKTKPILRLKNHKMYSLYNRTGKIQIYLPTNQTSAYPTIKPCFVNHPESLQFLKALGLQQPKDYEELKYHILPRYQKKETITDTTMRQDFKKIFHYYLNTPWHSSYLNQLKKTPFCRAEANKKPQLPTNLYFKTQTLKTYFNNNPTIQFLDNDFYATSKPHQKQYYKFFKLLGIEDKPRIIKIPAKLSAKQRQLIHNGQCTHDYYHLSQYTYDYELEGLDTFIQQINLKKSTILWHYLLQLIETQIKKFQGQYHWYYRREKYHHFDAKFLITLQNTAWLYSETDSNPQKPADISTLATHYETKTEAAKTLIKKLGIKITRQFNKQQQLEQKLKQHLQEITQIKTLETQINATKKYSFVWFNTLLELEYLLIKLNPKKIDSTIENPLFILETLKREFQNLFFNQHLDLKDKLPNNIEYIIGPPGTGKTTYLVQNHLKPLIASNLKILVLTPTNKAADVLIKKITEIPELDKKGIIRFGITEDKTIENSGILKNKSFDITPQCLLITTTARFLYDGFKKAQLKDYKWDIILFDEASMIMLAEIIYILYQQKPSKFIIVGDYFQIQPVVKAEKWQAENIYTLIGLNRFKSPQIACKITNLTTQYRSLPPIGALFSHFSYNGVLNHHRSIKETKLKLKPITVIKFPISQNELYRSRRFKDGGTYHIYSAILTVELALYLSKKIPQSLKIGIICPYLAQAKLVEKLLTVQLKNSSTPQIITGTVHRFQGDEFDIVLNLFNVPPRITPKIFPNRQHIVNVAISRAKDYLILIIPEIKEIEQLNRIEEIIFNNDEIKSHSKIYTATELEELILEKNFIAENTQITERQNINVYYAKAEYKYEVRIDDIGVDVQINF